MVQPGHWAGHLIISSGCCLVSTSSLPAPNDLLMDIIPQPILLSPTLGFHFGGLVPRHSLRAHDAATSPKVCVWSVPGGRSPNSAWTLGLSSETLFCLMHQRQTQRVVMRERPFLKLPNYGVWQQFCHSSSTGQIQFCFPGHLGSTNDWIFPLLCLHF